MTEETVTAGEACDRALRVLGLGMYLLGCGDYAPYIDTRAASPTRGKLVDLPWTARPDLYASGDKGSDCWGLIAYAWKTPRSRPGFNVGKWASVENAMNCDSVLEDGRHKQEFGRTLLDYEPPRPGDLIITPTIRLYRAGEVHPWFYEMGHVRICTKAPLAWDINRPAFVSCEIIELHGPNRAHGPIRTSGQHVDLHNRDWPKPEHRAHVVRPHERV